MVDLIRLPIQTSDGRPMMHKFYRQQYDPKGLIVLLPGGNYGVDGPMLYYLGEMLQASGWDSFAVTYGYQTRMEELSVETIPGLVGECIAAVQQLLSERTYPRVGLAGKSIGASVAAHICQVEPTLEAARLVLLNPPLGHAFFDSTFLDTTQPTFLATGTADRFYDAAALETLRLSRAFELCLIENADHSMDVVGNLGASVDAVKRVVAESASFLTSD
jgi:predicted alpha/beta-hydrolase family hydrolase